MFVRGLFAFALAGPAASLAQCSGSDDPVIPSSGACYAFSGPSSDIKWSLKLNLKSFARGKGTMDFITEGGAVTPGECKNHSFTKSGQKISVDSLSDCVPTQTGEGDVFEFDDLKYCSASDKFEVTYSIIYQSGKDTYSELLSRVTCQSCNGGGNPIVGCYKGRVTPGGQPYDTRVDVDSFTSSKGSMRSSVADGFTSKVSKCKDHSFTKSGQDISVDFSDCGLSDTYDNITLTHLKYCSVEKTFHAKLKFHSSSIPPSHDDDTEAVMLHLAGVPGSSECASSAVVV